MKKSLLLNKFTCVRTKPVNVIPTDFHLFAHEFITEVPASFVSKLNSLIFDSDLVIQLSQKRSLPIEVLYNCSVYRYASNKVFFDKIIKNAVTGKLSISLKPYCWVSDAWSGGYFHWLFDVLPRILVIHDQCIKYGIILPSSYRKMSFVIDSLFLLGVNKVKFLEPDNFYFFKSLIFPTHLAPSGNYNEVVVRNLRSYLLKDVTGFGLQHQRVFISRIKSTRRKILNEEDVVNTLERFNFKLVYCEDLTLLDQIKLFSQTKYLVSNHGAGLSNLLFMVEESKVLELRAQDDSHNNCYFSLASALGINYYYQLCNKQNVSENPHTADIYVDLDKLEANIINLLSA